MVNKVLGLDGFIYPSEKRNNETKNTLLWNARIFNEVMIMCANEEQSEYWEELTKGLDNVETQITNDHNPTFKFCIEYIGRNFGSDPIKIFANLDTTFTKDIEKLKEKNLENVLFTFTNRCQRRDNKPLDELGDPLDRFNKTLNLYDIISEDIWPPPGNQSGGKWQSAQCGWGWKTIRNLVDSNCRLGEGGAEGEIISMFESSGYNLRSAALLCPTYHNHKCRDLTDRARITYPMQKRIPKLL